MFLKFDASQTCIQPSEFSMHFLVPEKIAKWKNPFKYPKHSLECMIFLNFRYIYNTLILKDRKDFCSLSFNSYSLSFHHLVELLKRIFFLFLFILVSLFSIILAINHTYSNNAPRLLHVKDRRNKYYFFFYPSPLPTWKMILHILCPLLGRFKKNYLNIKLQWNY